MMSASGSEITRGIPPQEHPFWVEVYWQERGTDHDGHEVQRIEGYGFHEELKMRQFILDLLYKEGKDKVESFNAHYPSLTWVKQ